MFPYSFPVASRMPCESLPDTAAELVDNDNKFLRKLG